MEEKTGKRMRFPDGDLIGPLQRDRSPYVIVWVGVSVLVVVTTVLVWACR